MDPDGSAAAGPPKGAPTRAVDDAGTGRAGCGERWDERWAAGGGQAAEPDDDAPDDEAPDDDDAPDDDAPDPDFASAEEPFPFEEPFREPPPPVEVRSARESVA
ncbi:hypothetical protein ACFP6A_04095 [Quadrisphaera sp. GCM10027208]|uniref:hypothetical protein n=1 Tax=Quadrisphaera sp. GCM10027208 TaxID=3273423 RepID=UPI0036103AAC